MGEAEPRLWGTGGLVQEIIGLDNTAKLLKRYTTRQHRSKEWRRCRIPVPHPKRITPNCKLATVIGFDNALRLATEFGGETIELPRSRHIMIEHRNRLIAQMGKIYEPDEIAEMLTITPRTVRNIQKSYEGE